LSVNPSNLILHPLCQRYNSLCAQLIFFSGGAYVKIKIVLILASSSPRRQILLSLLGVDFQVFTSDIDEDVKSGETPEEYVLRLAGEKSRYVSTLTGADQIVIAADTAVVDGKQILGKPVDRKEALKMLRSLRAGSHHVFTGLVVRDSVAEKVTMELCVTEVQMRSYQESEIEAYVATGDPMDKAGAYAIQNPGFNPVRAILGCYANVVGLPLCHLTGMLQQMEVDIPHDATRGCRTAHGYSCQLIEKIQDFSSFKAATPRDEKR
jgi:septum formation protein